MIIPTTEQCMELLHEFRMKNDILLNHSILVNKIAMFLAKKLKQKGIEIDLDLVNAGSLLHDLDKMHTLNDPLNHGNLSEEWLKDREHSKVARVVLMHNMQGIIKNENPTWEEKVVNYADKRALRDGIISLDKRFDYIEKTYAETFEESHREFAKQIETEIFNKLDITPNDINEETIQ